MHRALGMGQSVKIFRRGRQVGSLRSEVEGSREKVGDKIFVCSAAVKNNT
jgi:hypothetical protein